MKSIALCMDTHVCRQMLFYRLVNTYKNYYIFILSTIENINNLILFHKTSIYLYICNTHVTQENRFVSLQLTIHSNKYGISVQLGKASVKRRR